MPASYPITFELRADDRASDSIRALLEVLHEGSSASAEALSRFKALREDVTLQTRAFNTLRTEWRADHETLYAFGRVASSVGSIGNQLLQTFNSLMLAQIAYAQTSAALSQATANVGVAQEIYNEMVATYGPTSQQAIDALNNLTQAQNSQISAQAQANQQAIQTTVLYLGVGLSVGSLVAQTISAAGAFSTFAAAQGTTATALAAGGAAFAGAAAAVAGLGAGFGAAVAVMIRMTQNGYNLGDAISWVNQRISALPGPLATVVGGFAGFFETIMTYSYNAGRATGDFFRNLFATTYSWGQSARAYLEGFWSWLTSSVSGTLGALQSAWASLWDSLAGFVSAAWDAVKPVLQPILDAINALANSAGTVSGAFSSIQSAGSAAGGTVAGAVSGAAGWLANALGLQEGGVVTEPTLALIGEAGPEAVVPLADLATEVAGVSGTALSQVSVGGAPPSVPIRSASAASGTTTYQVTVQVQGSVITEKQLAEIMDKHLYSTLSRLRQ